MVGFIWFGLYEVVFEVVFFFVLVFVFEIMFISIPLLFISHRFFHLQCFRPANKNTTVPFGLGSFWAGLDKHLVIMLAQLNSILNGLLELSVAKILFVLSSGTVFSHYSSIEENPCIAD